MTLNGKLAVVGCGYWGKNIVRVLSEIGSLVAICDIRHGVAEELAVKYNVPILNIDQILEDPHIDGVIIATPASEHASLAKQVLQNGKHVLVEKPLALTLKDALTLCDFSKELKKVFMVGHVLQYHPGYWKLKELIRKGAIGNIRYIHSKRLNLGKIERKENVLWSLAPHDISMILGIVGELPQSVQANGQCLFNNENEDIVTMDLSFKNGIKAQIHLSWLHPMKESSIIVVGETGMLIFDDIQPWEKKVQLHPYQIKLTDYSTDLEKGEVVYYPIRMLEPLKEECLHFIHSIENNSQPKTDRKEAMSVMQVLHAAQCSLDSQKSVELHSIFKDQTNLVDQQSQIGKDFNIRKYKHHFSKGTLIGENCFIGENVRIGANVKIGHRCTIQNNVILGRDITTENSLPTYVEKRVNIGTNTRIATGVRLGAYSLIEKDTVVLSNVKSHALISGNPAKQIGWVSHTGDRLDDDLTCPRQGRRYYLTINNELEEIKLQQCLEEEISNSNKLIPLIDLKSQQNPIRSQINASIERVLDHGTYIFGPEIYQFENLMSKFCAAKHAFACSNGTDALVLALLAKQVTRGDGIFIPSFTFAGTAEAVLRVNATIIFIDSLPDTFNIDANSLECGIQTAIKHGINPKGIITVDLFGQPADYHSVQSVAKKFNLWIICDAAQSFGASYGDRKVGTLGEITTTSFFPSKPLGCYGDGGAIFTDNDELASLIQSFRVHGLSNIKYDHIRVGLNSRLDTIQAAILIEKLKVFPGELVAREKAALLYNHLLKDVLQIPCIIPQATSTWAQYTVVLPKHFDRDELMESLKNENISTAVYYIKPMHLQKAYTHHLRANDSTLPVSEELSSRVLSLPMSAYVTDQDVRRVCEALKRYSEQKEQ